MIEQCLEFFCQHGFFASDVLSKAEQAMLREKLFSLLSLLISDQTRIWSTFAVLQIEKLEQVDRKKVVKLDREIKKVRKAGLKTVKKLRSKVLYLFLSHLPLENEE